MKKMKLAVAFAALVSVFGFSSCLNDSGSSDYPDYQAAVTVTGDEILGFRLYADNGSILIPTSQSVSQLPGLKNVKRLVIAFDLAGELAGTTPTLEPNKTYNVALSTQYYSVIPTSTVIDTYQNEAADTLMKNQDPIVSMEGLSAFKGYATTSMTVPYNQSKLFYMNAGYDSETDVDTSTGTLTLTVYYDSNSENAYSTGSSLFSFKLPEVEYGKFSADSINLVLQAKTTSSGDSFTTVKCRMAKSDLFPPRGY